MNKITLLLVDDHAVVRAGYRRLLENQPDLTVIGEAETAQRALDIWKSKNPDVIVLDIGLPDISGIELLQRFIRKDGNVRILIFSMHRDPIFISQAIRAGALGYVTKSSPAEIIIEAVYKVAKRQQFISPDISSDLAIALLTEPANPIRELSPREFEILQMLLNGLDAQAIADALSISSKTVHNYHYQIKIKLGVKNDIELARIGFKYGLI
ncbi:response regulator transcription factor [Sessilibacter sp. MAH1]